MPPDDDADDDRFGTPLPPEDRLWRHPSEMSGEGAKQQIVLISKTTTPVGRLLAVAVLAGLIGAGTTLGVVLGTDAFVRERPGGVSVQRVVTNPPSKPGEGQLAIAEQVLPAMVRVETTRANGIVNSTGVIFRSDGQIITTVEAIDGWTSITVYLSDGSQVSTPEVSLVGRSIDADVAVLKLADRTNLPVATGSTRQVSWGAETVMVDASPPTKGPDITVGVVTKEVASVLRADNQTQVYGLVQMTTRASVTPRSAGTVFVDNSGSVVGLVTSRADTAPRSTSGAAAVTPRSIGTANGKNSDDVALHYGIPAYLVWDVAGQIADEPGKGVVRPWIGLPPGQQEIDRQEANRYGIDGGMKITMVEPDSPAKMAGLATGDVIISVDKYPITSYNELVAALRRYKPGDPATVHYLRNGAIEYKYVTVSGKREQP